MHETRTRSNKRLTGPPHRRRAAIAFAVAFLLAATSVNAQFWKRDKPYPDETKIVITGVVSDVAGNPLPGLTVELIAKRYNYKLSKLESQVEREVSVSTTTNERGEYNLDWTWYRYYNDFTLQASLAVPTGPDSARKELMATTELNNRIEQGSPVIAPLTVTDPAFLETFRAFVAGLDTADERRVYTAQGRPDKVDVMELPDRTEEAWWYFDRGQVYRFVDGRLDQVENFDPVKP